MEGEEWPAIAQLAGLDGGMTTAKNKGARPLRVAGRQIARFARAPGGKPARANHIFG
jgi:hypothetical protein